MGNSGPGPDSPEFLAAISGAFSALACDVWNPHPCAIRTAGTVGCEGTRAYHNCAVPARERMRPYVCQKRLLWEMATISRFVSQATGSNTAQGFRSLVAGTAESAKRRAECVDVDTGEADQLAKRAGGKLAVIRDRERDKAASSGQDHVATGLAAERPSHALKGAAGGAAGNDR